MAKKNKPKIKPEFNKFWHSLTSKQKKELARKASLSVDYIQQAANGHINVGMKTFRALRDADERITIEMFD